MRTLLTVVFATLTLAALAVIALPYLVSTEWIRDQVTASVREHTGRTLVIAGETSLKVFPDLALVVRHAALSNPGGRVGDVARMEELDVGLQLMPLVDGRVVVDHLVVTRPIVSLEIDEAGRPNWQIGEAAGAADAAPATADTPAAAGGPAPADAPAAPVAFNLPIEALRVGEMRIVDGAVDFIDRRSGVAQTFRAINATVEMASLDEALAMSGSAQWQGEMVEFQFALAEPRALATGTPSAVTAKIDAPQLRAAYSGTLTTGEGPRSEGEFEASTPSVKDLARWFGTVPPRSAGLEALSLTASVAAKPDEIALSGLELTLDGISAEGGGLISLAGSRPAIQATLAADRIDFNSYVAPASDVAPNSTVADQGGFAGTPAGSPALAGWDETPIDISGLRAIDADLRLSARELIFRDVEAGQSALAVTLRDGVLTVDLSELQLYEGRAAGKITVNSIGDVPGLAASFTLSNVAALDILRDTARLEWLEGRGELTGALASRGISEREIVEALNGEATVRFTDGAVRGFNVASLMRGLKDGSAFDWSREDAQVTDFSELAASFTIARGIAQTDNLTMLGPLVRLSGVGVANLPIRQVDFRISPKLVASLEGQGGAGDLSGLEVPFTIRGSWDNPAITPDLAAVIADPQKAIDTIKEIGRSLKELGRGGNLGDAVGQIRNRQPKQVLELLMGGGLGTDPSGNQGGRAVEAGEVPPPITEDDFNRLLGN